MKTATVAGSEMSMTTIAIALGAIILVEAKETATAAGSEMSMTTIGIAVGVIVLVAAVGYSMSGTQSEFPRALCGAPGCSIVSVELHPEQKKFMEGKEDEHCKGNSRGKGIRVIIDYMTCELSPEKVKEILSEKPRHTEGFESFDMDLYDKQIGIMAEHGVKIGSEDEAEKYKDLSKACRAMLDYAARMEEEGSSDKIKSMFEEWHCNNC
jgi:hypothetical protein